MSCSAYFSCICFVLSLFGLGVGLCSVPVSGLRSAQVHTSCAAEASQLGSGNTVVCSV